MHPCGVRSFLALLVGLAACSDSQPPTGGQGGVSSAGGAGGLGGEGGLAGASSTGGGGAGGSFDCLLAPATPSSTTVLSGPRGYHGLAFTPLGEVFGLDSSNNLVRSTYDGSWSPYLANVFAEQIAFNDNGHLILAAPEGVVGITPDAQRYTINSEVYGYGLRIGPDSRIYLAEATAIRRLNGITGLAQTVVSVPDLGSGAYAHVFDFSPDLRKLYVGMTGVSEGDVRVVDLDEELNATSELKPFAELSKEKVWIDGVATDVCGNLYVANFSSSQLFKVTADGEVSVFVDWSADPTQYGHGGVFGNGVGGFRVDALYLPMPYNNHTVQEVVIGVPARGWGGTVLNGPG